MLDFEEHSILSNRSSAMSEDDITIHQQQQQPHQNRKRGQRITEYVHDRALRFKSYLRRRHVPFKRVQEIDSIFGTKSILIQISNDFDECLYNGPKELEEQFFSHEGITMHKLELVIAKMLNNPSKRADHSRQFPGLKLDDEDETSELLKPSNSLSDPNKMKSLKSRRDALMTKIQETDEVCGCQSFYLIVADKNQSAYYYGDPKLVSLFFSSGLSKTKLPFTMNVRQFDCEEIDYNVCSVSHCTVSRNFLSKWRMAAISLHNFPPELPMTLYACPEVQRPSWIAELDLDPNMNGKLCVCSFHFKEGRPTPKNPFPTEMLRPLKENEEAKKFRSSALNTSQQQQQPDENTFKVNEKAKTSEDKYVQFVWTNGVKRSKRRRGKTKLNKKDKNKRDTSLSTVSALGRRIVKRCLKNGLGSEIVCRLCKSKQKNTRDFFHHFVQTHHQSSSLFRKEEEIQGNDPVYFDDDFDDESKLVIDEEDFEAPKIKSRPTLKAPVQVSPEERSKCLDVLYRKQEVKTMNPNKKYVCAVCKSVCDLFGLFFHMKQVHKGILCQYCLKLFKKVNDLETHMKNAHKVQKRYYHSAEEFSKYAGTDYSFACSLCSKVIKYSELKSHPCNNAQANKRSYDCPFCERNFFYQSQIELHLCNGWCKGMTWLKKPTSEQTAKLYKVLTGIDLVQDYVNKPVIEGVNNKKANNSKGQQQQNSRKLKFDLADKQLLARLNSEVRPKQKDVVVLEGLPSSGSVFCNSKTMSSYVKSEIKNSGYTFDLNAKLKDVNLEPIDTVKDLSITRAGANFIINNSQLEKDLEEKERMKNLPKAEKIPLLTIKPLKEPKKEETKEDLSKKSSLVLKVPAFKTTAAVTKERKESKGERRLRIVNEIYNNMCRIKEVVDHFKEKCLFCQQTCLISVDTVFLLSHMMIIHDPVEVERILEEDPQHCITRIKKHLKDSRTRDSIFTYDITEVFKFNGYRCCYCSEFTCSSYTKLFDHLAESHQQKVLTCHLCQNIFINYGSYVSHVCFGPPTTGQHPRAKFGCKVCRKQDLGTFLEFQMHLRKLHNFCEICLHGKENQEALFHHCQTHSQELMCMKCFLTYEDRLQFKKHLYYKHDEEHKVCKTCHHKTWPHVYHFCIKLDEMICEVCDKRFDGLKHYRVHMRTHTGANPYLCSAQNCDKAYISRQLLWKHHVRRHPELRANALKALEEKRIKRDLVRYNASSIDHVTLCMQLVEDLARAIIQEEKPVLEEEEETPKIEEAEDKWIEEEAGEVAKEKEEAEEEVLDPIDLAVMSIMGPEGTFAEKSPTKMPPLSPIKQPDHGLFEPTPSRVAPTHSLTAPPPPQHHLNEQDSFEPPPLMVRAPTGPAPMRPQLLAPTHSSTIYPPTTHHVPKGARVRLPVRPGGARILTPQVPQPPPGYGPIANNVNNANRDYNKHQQDSSTDEASEDEEVEKKQPVVSGIWNQDLMLIGGQDQQQQPALKEESTPNKKSKKKVKTLNPKLLGGWELDLSESSGSDGETTGPKKPKWVEKSAKSDLAALKDHDYCYQSFLASQPREDLTEMGKILSNVAMGGSATTTTTTTANNTSISIIQNVQTTTKKKKKKSKKSKKKKKKKKSSTNKPGVSSSSDSEVDVDVDVTSPKTSSGLANENNKNVVTPKVVGPKPKYHTPGASTGVTAGTARPRFSSSSEDEMDTKTVDSSDEEMNSSDLDTDFEADELLVNLKQIQSQSRRHKPSAKAVEAQESADLAEGGKKTAADSPSPSKPALKLKIKLPPKPGAPATPAAAPPAVPRARMVNTALTHKSTGRGRPPKVLVSTNTTSSSNKKKPQKRKTKSLSIDSRLATQPLSKKMRESLALNQPESSSSSSSGSSSSEGEEEDDHETDDYNPTTSHHHHVPEHPDGGIVPFVDNRLYCVCQCPHDDVSEMIGCDAPDCRIEWFHFECVGIMVPPEGKWYCPECSKRYKIHA